MREEEGHIILSNCNRGTNFTIDNVHIKGAIVKFMCSSGDGKVYYPATIDMTLEQSDNLFKIMKETDQKLFVTDGFESCLEAGYGCYTANVFADNFYKKGKANNMDFFWTGSNFSNYSWHHTTHISWGEIEALKDIRGSMIEHRLSRQVLLGTSLMPKKLGQYHPYYATVADIEWIEALATGWDSGCDFFIKDLDAFKKNPQYKEIIEKINLWTEAREKNIFTEEQKRAFRQTDREYTLTKNGDGTWNVKFVRYWMDKKVEVRPSSDLPVKSISGTPIRDCSIDWSWTHNPGTYFEVMLSDDMIHNSGNTTSEWEVSYPKYVNPKGSWSTNHRYFQFVLRVPEDAPCAVKDFVITFNGHKMKIPMTLKPGEYLTMPHLLPLVCVYNSKHELIEERLIRGDIPAVLVGESAKITLSGIPIDNTKAPKMIMNVRNMNGFFFFQSRK